MKLTKRDLLKAASVTLASPLILKTSAIAQPSGGAEIEAGLAYFRNRAEVQYDLCKGLTAALRSGDLNAAKAAYATARPPYEEIEVHAGAFGEIDADVDARPYAFDGGEMNAEFRGFHRIETLIFRDEDIAAAVPYAEKLEQSMTALSKALNEPDRFTDQLFFDGMIALPEEVASKKISSEEETWSDLSLIIFRHNFIGVQSQFAAYAPLVSERANARASLAFLQAHAVLDPYFEGRGVTAYSDVRSFERRRISKAAYSIRDAMEAAADELSLL